MRLAVFAERIAAYLEREPELAGHLPGCDGSVADGCGGHPCDCTGDLAHRVAVPPKPGVEGRV